MPYMYVLMYAPSGSADAEDVLVILCPCLAVATMAVIIVFVNNKTNGSRLDCRPTGEERHDRQRDKSTA